MRNPIIRTIYLYLFALIGLGMLVVGCSMIINLGLKTWVFANADFIDGYMEQPFPLYIEDSTLKTVEELKICGDKCELTNIQKEQVDNWLIDYTEWKQQEGTRDTSLYVTRSRERQTSTALSLIVIGLPLWLFHWFTIKKDIKRKKEV